ncbi:tripartite tricarboxylate transporter TctB family protein [Hoeflea poritis]|uniref:Tripartite tricarboxylate transporter TctB family protein n=1 Tax=Hoeflea poritis TaxID=2993659 RepID=A0ABT4VVI1_9HYPH|nr:tripartite tricarboxylate transporter TctB family protein [Hoeflea poritis]MDA4848714.1 tripartite tricarboxylate transporter TctB family protein [Hoeflea poritis]
MKKAATGAVAFGLAVFFFVSSFWIVDGNYDPIGPRLVPQATIVLIGALSLWILVEGLLDLRSSKASGDEKTAFAINAGHLKSIGIVLCLAVYIWVLNSRLVGFEIVTGAFLFVAGMIIHPVRGKALSWLVGLSVVLPSILNFVFSRLFFVNLP